MIDDRALFQEKIGRLLRWEKVKRREQILVTALFYSVLASLVILPMGELFPPWARPVSFTPIIFLIMALMFFLRHPWGGRESLRTVIRLDKSLRMQERALTAWEIVRREGRKPAELLVLEEAAAKLKAVDVEGLFKRHLSWHAFLAPPLFFIWMWMAWFGVDFDFNWGHQTKARSVAKRLKEYSQDLRVRAEEDKLIESLKMAHALEEVAERGMKEEIGEARLRDDLNEAVRGIRDLNLGGSEGSGFSLPEMSGKGYSDLKTELEKIREALNQSDSLLDKGILGSTFLEKLDRLSPFRGELGEQSLSSENLDKKEMMKFLKELEEKTRAELDRRALMETQQYLLLLLDGMEGDARRPLESRQSPLGSTSTTRDDKTKGRLPGDQPGTREPRIQFPRFRARAETHLKGLVEKGLSAGFTLRGEVKGKESKIPQEDIVAQYRRQAEGELASEQIPQDLKETIKKYFLSLGMTQDRSQGRK